MCVCVTEMVKERVSIHWSVCVSQLHCIIIRLGPLSAAIVVAIERDRYALIWEGYFSTHTNHSHTKTILYCLCVCVCVYLHLCDREKEGAQARETGMWHISGILAGVLFYLF